MRCTGGGKREGRKQESQSGGKQEKEEELTQHCIILLGKGRRGRI